MVRSFIVADFCALLAPFFKVADMRSTRFVSLLSLIPSRRILSMHLRISSCSLAVSTAGGKVSERQVIFISIPVRYDWNLATITDMKAEDNFNSS